MKENKPMMILIVIVIVVLLGYILPIVFSFENDHESNNYQQIDDQYINILYSYLPADNYSIAYNNYNTFYTEKHNLSKTTLMAMTYNYIINSNRFMLITMSDNEKEDNALYKISVTDMKKAYQIVFCEDDFQAVDFDYNDIKGIVREGYIYIYKNSVSEDYTNYKNIDSYALAKNGDEIIIYEHFVKCNKLSNVCYNDGSATDVNSRVSNNNFTDLNNIAKYKHVFKFDGNNYHWYSTERVD